MIVRSLSQKQISISFVKVFVNNTVLEVLNYFSKSVQKTLSFSKHKTVRNTDNFSTRKLTKGIDPNAPGIDPFELESTIQSFGTVFIYKLNFMQKCLVCVFHSLLPYCTIYHSTVFIIYFEKLFTFIYSKTVKIFTLYHYILKWKSKGYYLRIISFT
jgi:hypothetical protein